MKQAFDSGTFRLQETRARGCGRFTTFYVVRVKGDGGVDWEWTEDPKQAAWVSSAWARKYARDREACGSKAWAVIDMGAA